MDTTGRRLASIGFLLLLLPLVFAGSRPIPRVTANSLDLDGDASSGIATKPPNESVQAAFAARSYAPGTRAILRLRGTAPVVRIRLFRAGAGHDGPLQGAPADSERTLTSPSKSVALQVGSWQTGLYYARVTTPGRGVWYAPFVLRPQHLGAHRVLVVLPTNTWQAYNFEDGDSWYENSTVHSIDLTRPYIDGGVPPHYHGYDRGFVRWLAVNHKQVDFLSDDDLDQIRSGSALTHAYDLIIVSGHEEYVTGHEYDLIRRYRDLGGNLAFLSANDIFYKVVKHGDTMAGRWRWRDLGRPEAALVGAQYVDWNHNEYSNRPFIATGVAQAPWLFEGTELRNGDTFGVYGIEVDARTTDSPHGTRVLAHIPGIFGAGKNAEMTYYTTPAGAKVFSAGVMNFGGSALWPVVSTMMQNLWTALSKP
ncbi:MAG: hypothetical protein QOF27_1480 [Gaiellaceae bacterium]|nr:hypothetical protein [Gaiellaceae bacterium]